MAQKFENGTVVWLKSGSPAMTISVLHTATGKYRCSWFVGTELKTGEFTEEQLTDEEPTISLD